MKSISHKIFNLSKHLKLCELRRNEDKRKIIFAVDLYKCFLRWLFRDKEKHKEEREKRGKIENSNRELGYTELWYFWNTWFIIITGKTFEKLQNNKQKIKAVEKD